MMKNVLLSMFLFLSFSACSQTIEKEGLLWKISGEDIEQPSYLFGTFHGGNNSIGAEFLDSIPGFYDAFNSVTQFVGESDFSQASEISKAYFEKHCGERMMPSDTTYQDLLNENDYQYLDSVVLVSGNTFLSKIPIRPNYLFFLIVQSKQSDFVEQISGDAKKEAMDIYLYKRARERGYEVKGLDSPEAVFKTYEVLFGEIPLPQSLQESADTLINNIKKISEEPMYSVSDIIENIKKFGDAYKRQDLSELEKYKKEQVEMMKNASVTIDMNFLREERNLSWVEKIPELISSQPAMIGVGACHLYGKDGLINLLRQKGYKLEVIK